MKNVVTVEDVKQASEFNIWLYKSFKKIVEFDCKAQGIPAPNKINNARFLEEKIGQRNFVVATCEFSNGMNKTFKYPLEWFMSTDDKKDSWKQILADQAASRVYKSLDDDDDVINPLYKTYEVYEGFREITTFDAHCDMDAIEMFHEFVVEHGFTLIAPGEICGLHPEDSDECLATWENKTEIEEDSE